MRCALAVALCMLAVCVLSGCNRDKRATTEPSDVEDRDFVALIRKTSSPQVFEVEIKKVNPRVDKKISGLGGMVDLVFRSASGKVFAADHPWEGAKYAEEVTKVFEWPRPPAVSLKGRVRLLRGKLPPGTYTVEPRARFAEVGKDRLSGPCADGGTVAIPAANSVQVVVR